MSVLWKILKVSRLARTRNVDIMKELRTDKDIVLNLQKRMLQYFGYAVRM